MSPHRKATPVDQRSEPVSEPSLAVWTSVTSRVDPCLISISHLCLGRLPKQHLLPLRRDEYSSPFAQARCVPGGAQTSVNQRRAFENSSRSWSDAVPQHLFKGAATPL